MPIPAGNPADRSRAAVPANISRRTFVAAAGAAFAGAVVGGTGIVAATARALPARASTPVHFFGSTAGPFNEIRSGVVPGVQGLFEPVPGLLGIRLYGEYPVKEGNRLVNRLARRWPAGPSPATQGPMVYSIYPLLDTMVPGHPGYKATIKAIRNIIATAPPHSYLTAWHEALNHNKLTPPGATPAKMRALHSTLNRMCQGTNVTYGSIFGGSPKFFTAEWNSVPKDLGFYGIDVYGGGTTGNGKSGGRRTMRKNMGIFDNFITAAKKHASSGYPKIIVAETNNNSSDANRVAWFTDVAERMRKYGTNAVGILTFWHDNPRSLSGPWPPNPNPSDRTVMHGMNYVINNVLACPESRRTC